MTGSLFKKDDPSNQKRFKNSNYSNDVKPTLTANKQSNKKLLDISNGLKETSASEAKADKLLKIIVTTSISQINYSDSTFLLLICLSGMVIIKQISFTNLCFTNRSKSSKAKLLVSSS
jgi:hypothetical protein